MAENPRNEDEIPIKSARLYHQPATRYHSVGYMYVYIYIRIHPHLSPLCPHAAAPFKGGNTMCVYFSRKFNCSLLLDFLVVAIKQLLVCLKHSTSY